MNTRGHTVSVAILLLATTADARLVQRAPVLASTCSPQEVVLRQPLDFSSKSARHAYLSTHDSDYRSALGWRAGGIALALVGGSGGLVLAAVGMATFKVDGSLDAEHRGSTGGGSGTEALLLGGMATALVSVAVGLPIALSAHRRLGAIRSRYPIVGVGVTRDSKSVQLSWRF